MAFNLIICTGFNDRSKRCVVVEQSIYIYAIIISAVFTAVKHVSGLDVKQCIVEYKATLKNNLTTFAQNRVSDK